MKIPVFILCVVSLFLSTCHHKSEMQLTNDTASLPSTFRFDTLGLKVMASIINNRSGSMSILYANQLALSHSIKDNSKRTAGEVMALVTWKQQDDPHWFGARIPGTLQSVEIVKTTSGADDLNISYVRYIGENLLVSPTIPKQENRIKYILKQRPSVLP